MIDARINIATGYSAGSKRWKNESIYWSDLKEKLKDSQKTGETLAQFLKASSEEQKAIKDVGGYVGGYLRNGRRGKQDVVNRQLLTLDIDFATLNFFEEFKFTYDCAAFIHSTHKHSDASPRYRLLIPLDREVSPDEYLAIGHKVAGELGIDLFDATTFEPNRLMFWPSHPADQLFYWAEQEGEFLNADEVLAQYTDWRDTSLWPTSSRTIRALSDLTAKQADPLEKQGIVGAFCRTYSIEEAIAAYLPEVYLPATDGRYTYAHGSTSCGLVIYDGKFAFSHHGTDPAGGILCNAFDLVRLHKYGARDGEKNGRSFSAMEFLAMDDENVRRTISLEKLKDNPYNVGEQSDESIEWAAKMDVDGKGNYLSTAGNLNLIFQNDINIKDLFKYNEFDGKRYLMRSAPWRSIEKAEPLKNVDYAGVRSYIETVYSISSQTKIEDALTLAVDRAVYHPVREYLEALSWDGIKRVDTLLIDYFGTEDTLYTREAMRKTLVGAVQRIFTPGCKFDTILTLVGGQGIGKSTFIKLLGKDWHSDTLTTVTGKEAFEQLQGAWIIEMAELAALKKSEVEAVKHFVTKQVDTFRPAYARVPETYPRQSILIASTNETEFLRDPTGNRRFLPVDVGSSANAKKRIFGDLYKEVNQIWAEAVEMYHSGETSYLSGTAARMATDEQIKHSETDERTGVLKEYLATPVPENWDKLDAFARMDYFNAVADKREEPSGKLREEVCIAEIWSECFGQPKEKMTRWATRELNEIMKSLPEWEFTNSVKRFKLYGVQKYFKRRKIEEI